MKRFFVTIRVQLTLLVMLACLIVFSLCGGIFIYHSLERFKTTQIEHMQNLAQAHTHSFTKVLLLDDRDAAADIITSLRSYSYVEQVYLFDIKQQPKLRYQNQNSLVFIEPSNVANERTELNSDRLQIYLPVSIQGTRYGSVYMQLSLDQVLQSIEQSIVDALLIIPLVITISLVAAYFTQFIIARPLLELRNKVNVITVHKKFDRPLDYRHKNEMGQLYKGLNSLLVTIEQMKSELLQTNSNLEYKVEQRSQKLAEVQKQLSEAEKMDSLGGLVSGVAHEINTPLGIAVTTNSFMTDEIASLLEAIDNGKLSKKMLVTNLTQFSDALGQSDKAINRVIELLSSFKEVGADHIVDPIRPVKLVPHIDKVMQSFSVILQKETIHFEVDGDANLEVTTHPSAITQLVSHLVQNSVRHGFENKERGIVHIDLSENKDGFITLHYWDDGQGMSEQVLDNIFEPFYTTKRAQGGIGLGMNIVYAIVQKKLGGSISVSSEIDKGAQFIIRIAKEIHH